MIEAIKPRKMSNIRALPGGREVVQAHMPLIEKPVLSF